MNLPQVFTYNDSPMRSVLIDGEPWFVAADVCAVLDIGDPRKSVGYLDEDERTISPVIDSMGRTQNAFVINEAGLFSLILRSRKPEAKTFKRWITHEVLPAIRRTGSYSIPQQQQFEIPQTMADALQLAADLARQVDAKDEQLAVAAPKVEAYDALMDAEGLYTMEATAKILGTGRNTLYRWLRELRVIQPGSTMPYQAHMGRFVVTAASYTSSDGMVHATYTPRVKPDSLEYLRRRLVDAGYLAGTSLSVIAGGAA